MTAPTPFERDRDRLARALDHPGAPGPVLQRVAGRLVDELPPTLLGDLLQLLEAPARRAAALEAERLAPQVLTSETTTVEGLTRAAHDRAAVIEDLAARRAARR